MCRLDPGAYYDIMDKEALMLKEIKAQEIKKKLASAIVDVDAVKKVWL